jgi:transcriptional regulator with XRE-family HTH domain
VTTVGERVLVARENKGWTQGDLATAVGMTQDKISRIENDDRRMVTVELARVAMALGVDVDELVFGKLEMAFRGDPNGPGSPEAIELFRVYVKNWRKLRGLASLAPR